ncbi:MAG: hypothetical protein IIW20_04545 [Clostridia bacterium]|nr:hypothetical protein [Clostridia bacterium]
MFNCHKNKCHSCGLIGMHIVAVAVIVATIASLWFSRMSSCFCDCKEDCISAYEDVKEDCLDACDDIRDDFFAQ